METAIADNPILKEVPSRINDSEILTYLHTKDINWEYVITMQASTDFDDAVLSDWLNISVDTLWEYKKPGTRLKENAKEQILLLLSLIKHGSDVFGTSQKFDEWLTTKNFFFDYKPPMSYLNTVTGIHFVDDRLTGMEYGDNI